MELKNIQSDLDEVGIETEKISRQLLKKDPSKRKKISDYELRNKMMNAGLKPPRALFDTFTKEADLMGTYKRYCTEYYEAISSLRRKFAEAFTGNDIEQMVELYEELESLKQQYHRCHN